MQYREFPNQRDSRSRRMVWSMVSKAADRSSKHRQETCCEPMALEREENSFRGMKLPICRLDGFRSWLSVRCSVRRDMTTRSRIFDIKDKLEMGR